MDYSVWYALAKSEYFVWFLIVAVLVVGLFWIHYQRVLKDLLCSDDPASPVTEQKE